jgi:hypothetical protein
MKKSNDVDEWLRLQTLRISLLDVHKRLESIMISGGDPSASLIGDVLEQIRSARRMLLILDSQVQALKLHQETSSGLARSYAHLARGLQERLVIRAAEAINLRKVLDAENQPECGLCGGLGVIPLEERNTSMLCKDCPDCN